jgi:hypothetical protein
MAKLSVEERFQREMDSLSDLAIAWEPIHRRVKWNVEFLIDGCHYKDDDPNDPEKDSTEIRWVGEEGFHRYRHELGAVTQPGTMSARSLDPDGNQELGDLAVRVLMSDMENPAKEVEDNMDDVVGSASAAMYGVGWLDHLPKQGPWGEIIFSSDDPRNFMCDMSVKSVHDYRCRVVVRKVRMTIGEMKQRMTSGSKGWNAQYADQLVGDNGHTADVLSKMSLAYRTENGPNLVLTSKGSPSEPKDVDRKSADFYFVWRRHSDDEEDITEYEDWAPGDRFMRCTSCGYRTVTQDKFGDMGMKQDLPEELDGACPECTKSQDPNAHGDMIRIDGDEDRLEMLAYPDGYLCILAPSALPGVRDFVFEGKWPWKIRSYPCMFLPRNRHPFKIVGPSISDLTAWNQISTDMLMRLVLERMVQTAPIPLLPADGIEDARGRPFQLTTENGMVAFYSNETGTAPQTEMIGGDPGIPAVWSSIYQGARQSLTGSTGMADVSISDAQSRDIAASSLALQVRQEEIPVAHFKRRYQRQRGLLAGVWWDMLRDTEPGDRLSRIFGDDTGDVVKAMAASDLPNVEFFFDSSPDLLPQDEQAQAASKGLIDVIENKPWAVDFVARTNHFSPTLVRKARQDYAKWKQDQGPQGPQMLPEKAAELITSLAAIVKAGLSVTQQQFDAAMQLAGLPVSQGAPAAATPAAAAGLPTGRGASPNGAGKPEAPSQMVNRFLQSVGPQQTVGR